MSTSRWGRSRSSGRSYAAQELHWGPPKSEARERELVASPFVLEALRRHRAAQNERRLLYGAALRDERLVVDHGDGAVAASDVLDVLG